MIVTGTLRVPWALECEGLLTLCNTRKINRHVVL
jgi:hypothetical protein